MTTKVTYAIVRIDGQNTESDPKEILQDLLGVDQGVEITSVRCVNEDDSWVDQPVLYWP
jgi:hypothetical protein